MEQNGLVRGFVMTGLGTGLLESVVVGSVYSIYVNWDYWDVKPGGVDVDAVVIIVVGG